tara:strand:+ start:750 stop:1004 length:255 start_codon:yes stop_codon:yes gene_type:complete
VITPKPIHSTFVISIPFLLMGCTSNSYKSGTPALFETKIEAEKAAKSFNCTGAHKMGKKWMPCRSHETRYETGKDQSHTGHHRH